jgi:hypothetical protein
MILLDLGPHLRLLGPLFLVYVKVLSQPKSTLEGMIKAKSYLRLNGRLLA